MSSQAVNQVIKDLERLKNPRKASDLQRFFQTGPGGYGEGDLFLGITVPQTRVLARHHAQLSLADIEELLLSEFHEIRFCALVILTEQYRKTKNLADKKKIFEFYVRHIKNGAVNNWDLIDVPGSVIAEYLTYIEEPLDILVRFAKSRILWIRRSAVIFTFPFIRQGTVDPTLVISELLLTDKHDLIHKATGWALREVGKRDISALRSFLTENSHKMPRTMLRYAIEKLPESERQKLLRGISQGK
jgi:3-methyladenine DNA glycosylase AlkD